MPTDRNDEATQVSATASQPPWAPARPTAAEQAHPRAIDRAGSRGRDPRQVLWLVGRLFPRNPETDLVRTRAALDCAPDVAWQKLMFYEDVPRRPPLLLRLLLPVPVRTQSVGKRTGAVVECTYSHGTLRKRLTLVDPPRQVRFEVLEQHLGVERCMHAVEGSYEFCAVATGTELTLATRYHGHLRPRWLWRRVERRLAHQLHCHILGGMGAERARVEQA